MKKIVCLALTLVLMLSLTACNTNNLAEYKKALEKTEQITRGQTQVEFSSNVDINTEGMSAETIKELDYYKDMKGSFNVAFDEEAKKSIFRSYINFGGLGFDYDLYFNDGEIIMKLPVAGKYMRMNEVNNSSAIEESKVNGEIISESTMKAISEKWVELMNEENVFRGKDIILTTPDGEVKTSEYSITLSNQQIKSLFSDTVDSISKDTNLKQLYEEYRSKENKKSFEDVIKLLRDNAENYSVENFKYVALVDIDGYIVSENIEFHIKAEDKSLIIREVDYKLNVKNWDINKEQVFDFPVLNDKNSIKADNAKEIPDVMKSLFDKE